MNKTTAALPHGQRVPRWACALAAAGVLLSLAACQSPSPNTDGIVDPAPRTAPQRPAGVDIERPADRIDEILRRTEATGEARNSGRPADRIEEELIRERDAAVGRVPGCLRHVVVAAPRGEEALVCIHSHD